MTKDLLSLGSGQPINAFIMDEQDKMFIETEVLFPESFFYDIYKLPSSVPVTFLRTVDLYTNTVFNNTQIKIILNECEILKETFLDSNRKLLVEGLEKICQETLKELYHYLIFRGN